MTRRQYLKYVVCSILFLEVFSCSPSKDLSKDELISFIKQQENGLQKHASSLGVDYSVTYRPLDLIIEQSIKSNPHFNIDSIRTTYSDCFYFILKISKDDSNTSVQSDQSFTSYLKTISFDLSDYITLNGSNSIFHLYDFTSPRTYGETGSTSIILCFKDKRLRDLTDFTISIKDFINDNEEELQFSFLIKDIKKIPALELSEV